MRIWYYSTKNIIMVNYPMVMRFSMTDQIVSWGCLLMLNILSHLLPLHNLTVNLTLREINASTYEWHTACPFGLRVFDLPPLSDTTYTHKDLRWSVFVFIYDDVKYLCKVFNRISAYYVKLPAYLLNLFWFGYDYYVSIITNVFYVTTLQKPWAGLISF